MLLFRYSLLHEKLVRKSAPFWNFPIIRNGIFIRLTINQKFNYFTIKQSSWWWVAFANYISVRKMKSRSKARNVFASSNTGIVGPIPLEAWMHVCVYSVFVLFCVRSGFATGWSPVQGVQPPVHNIHISELILNGKQTSEPNPSRWKKTEAETFHTNDTIFYKNDYGYPT
jgi:hypothetical protein